MEEQFWRSILFHNYLDYLSQNGYEHDESVKGRAVQEQQNLLMKMFALSCTLEREFRCMELAELMTQNATNLAIKYASRSRRLVLAQRLSDLAAERAAELAAAEKSSEEETEQQQQEDFRNHLNAGYSNTLTEWSQTRVRNLQCQQSVEKDEDVAEQAEEDTPDVTKPTVTVSGNQGRINPFKVSNSQKNSLGHSVNILDNMTKLPKRNTTPTGRAASSKEKGPVIKPLMPKPKLKQAAAAAFFQPRTPSTGKKPVEEKGEKNGTTESESQTKTEDNDSKRPKTGFQMWLEENRSCILTDNPHFEETEIIKEGMNRFRALSAEERMAWTEKAKGKEASDPVEVKKRKRPEGVNGDGQEEEAQKSNQDSSAAKKSKSFEQSTIKKLSAFAYKAS
ncbi:hypothetical protein JD844_020349 [Phrynosoma platyrhinos]|uniref:HMG box domain-containing protein n=1 Tax=Phrynosoma platyrhinos TaxID=52577 RepID=A0ABQ7SSF0_PHRPL|nr:hypothetical protein JD844_020349 [Phrynosoma platyrhinos]